MGGITLFVNKKSKTSIWFAFTCFSVGCGCADPVFNEVIYVVFKDQLLINQGLYEAIKLICVAMNSFSNFMSPYFASMLMIFYSDIFKSCPNKKLEPLLTIGLLILPILMFFIFPIRLDYPKYINYAIISLWAVPYITFSGFLALYVYLKEKNMKVKEQRLLFFLVVVISLQAATITSYVLPAIGIQDAWFYNRWIAFIVFASFIFAITRFGLLGVRMRFEKYKYDSAIKTINSGTVIINHAVKNEVAKIAMCVENLNLLSENKSKMAQDNLKVISNSVDHLLSLVDKVRDNLKEIILTLKPARIRDIVDEAINLVAPFCLEKEIKIEKEFLDDPIILCDEVHIRETLINIFKNAIEVVWKNGVIEIKIFRSGKSVIITVTDNGPGIDKKTLLHIMEPFYSTKKRSGNFGLGLSYCYNVMQKHNGLMEIESEVEKGTKVYIHFPDSKYIKSK